MRRIALVLIVALVVSASAVLVGYRSTTPAPQAASSPKATRALVKPKPRSVRRARNVGPPRISIPRLHFKARVFPASKLALGPAWWPITGRPGGGDTVAIAGHRTTHTHPFYYLDRLRLGDAIYITYEGEAYRYRVDRIRVFSATNLHIADAVGHERLLLSACTPRGSAAFRLVVQARPA